MSKDIVDIEVLYEDDDYLAINKPTGLLVQAKNSKDEEYTVVDYISDKTTDSEIARPGIIHRLDRGTSGVMLLAKSMVAREAMQKQFAERSVRKDYVAICFGKPKNDKFLIDLPIQRNPKAPATYRVNPSGKPSTTLVEVIKSTSEYSFLNLKPRTGRTHQIRVHLQYIGCPILNDNFYATRKDLIGSGRLMLHARSISFMDMEGKDITVESVTPQDFEEVLSD